MRIRIEFASGGEALPYQAQLYAVPVDQLTDGDTVTLSNTLSVDPLNATASLEVEFGALLNLPTGAAINEGDTLTISDAAAGIPPTVFTFTETGSGLNPILINDLLTSAQVANATNAAIQAAGFTTARDLTRPQLVNIPSATIEGITLPAGTQIGNRGLNPNSVAIELTIASTLSDVREAMRSALAQAFNVPGQETNTSVYPISGVDGILLYDFVFTNLGPFRAFGGQNTGINNPAGNLGIYDPSFGTANPNLTAFAGRFLNDGSTNFGVYIDDVIIGLAERGELVRNATPGITNPVPNLNAGPSDLNFGSFQVEVRTSAEYGASTPGPPLTQAFVRNTYDSNDIVGEGFGLVATNAPQIADGDTFTLSNGIDLVTFEFEDSASPTGVTSGNIPVPFQSSFTDVELTNALLSTFNSPAVTNTLGLTAQTVSGQITGATTNRLVFLGPASADQLGGVDFGLPRILTPVLYGVEAFVGTELGDDNRERDQGQLIIENTIVRDSSGTGIIIDAGRRDRTDRESRTGTTTPRPGAPINFPTPNTAGFLPGAVLRGNLVTNNGTGIEITGDGGVDAGAPSVRVVNNTVFGNQIGIDVDSGAAPTLLNNIVSTNSVIGIQVPGPGGNATDNLSRTNTVVARTLFHDNGTDINNQAINGSALIADGTQVFVDANALNFFPEESSFAIDASLASQEDRAGFENFRESLGLLPSPILAPTTDLFGQTQTDGMSPNSPPGSSGNGGNVFIDLGAIDRADVSGPQATLLSPLDNDSDNIDLDSDATRIQLASGTLNAFDILVSELSGTGPNPASITSDRVYVTEDGQLLEEGRDYIFGYNTANRTIRLTPLSGIWRPDAVYEITLNNRSRLEFQTPSGDAINDGDQLTVTNDAGIQRVFEFDSGFAIEVPQNFGLQVLSANNGFAQGDTFTITDSNTGVSETFEINQTGIGVGPGNISVDLSTAGTITDVRDAIFDAINDPAIVAALGIVPATIGDDSLQIGGSGSQVLSTVFTQNGAVQFGEERAITNGQIFTFQSGNTTTTFEFNDDGSVVSGGDLVAIPFERTDTSEEIAEKIAVAAAGANIGLEGARSVGDGVVVFGGNSQSQLDIANSSLDLIATPGVTGSLSIEVADGESAATLDGTTFTVTVDGTTETFTLSTTPIAGSRVVLLNAGDNVSTIANNIASEIAIAFPSSTAPTATEGIVTLGESADSLVGIASAAAGLVVDGVSGGSIAVDFFPGEQFSSNALASGLINAIQNSGSNVSAFTPGGGLILLENASLVELTSSTSATTVSLGSVVEPIADFAENNLLANRVNSETAFTIVMPLVELDFGDAPASFGTLFSDNGARHTVNAQALPRLGSFVDTEVDALAGIQDDVPLNVVVSQTPDPMGLFDITTTGNTTQISLTGSPVGAETLSITVAGELTTFEFVEESLNPSNSNTAIFFNATDTTEELTTRLASAIELAIPQSNGGLVISSDISNSISIEAIDDEDGISAGILNDGTTNFNVFTSPGTDPNNIQPADVLGFLNPLDPAGTNIAVNVFGAGLLQAWIDFDQNGVFDNDEQVLVNTPVSGDPINGTTNIVTVFTPSDALTGETSLRLRISESGNLSPTGVAVGGEVEDHLVEVISIPLPTPDDDTFSINEDQTLDTLAQGLLPVADGDTIPPEVFLPVAFTAVDQPTFGTLVSLDATTGHFVYQPDPDFNGVDTFTYRLSTQLNGSTSTDLLATVTIEVAPVNDAPGGSGQTVVALEDLALTLTASDLLVGATPDESPSFVSPSGNIENQAALNESNQLTSLAISQIQGSGAACLLYTSPSPRDRQKSRMPSSA